MLCGLAGAQNTVTVPEEIVTYPNMIIHNGKIATMDDTSVGLNTSPGSSAEAMAVLNDKILAIGSNAQILRLAGPQTDRIDLKGRTVIPGIVNTHVHIHNDELNYWVGQNPEVLTELAEAYNISGLTDAELEQGIKLAVQEHVGKTAPGRWAFIDVGTSGGGGSGMGLGVAFLAGNKFTKQMLDQLAPDHPLILQSHPSYVANTAFVGAVEKLYGSELSLEAAGIDEHGRVRGTAPQYKRGLIIDQYFNTRVGELAEIVEQSLAKNAALGVTTFSSHIMGLRFLDAFNMLVRQKRMPIRLRLYALVWFPGRLFRNDQLLPANGRHGRAWGTTICGRLPWVWEALIPAHPGFVPPWKPRGP